MRMLKFVFPMILALGVGAGVSAAEKENKPADEKAQDQTGTISGTLHLPEKEAPRGCVAALHQPGTTKGEESIFFLFADGSTEKKLKDLAKKGANVTVSGSITKDGYRVTAISNSK